MASHLATASVEQCCTIKFLVEVEMIPAEIFYGLNAQYGEETPSHANDYDWYSKFPESSNEVWNIPHGHVQPTAVCSVNIPHVAELILGNREIMLHDTASNSGISVGSVEPIIREHLLLNKMSRR
jgi:hypothetical protein